MPWLTLPTTELPTRVVVDALLSWMPLPRLADPPPTLPIPLKAIVFEALPPATTRPSLALPEVGFKAIIDRVEPLRKIPTALPGRPAAGTLPTWFDIT